MYIGLTDMAVYRRCRLTAVHYLCVLLIFLLLLLDAGTPRSPGALGERVEHVARRVAFVAQTVGVGQRVDASHLVPRTPVQCEDHSNHILP